MMMLLLVLGAAALLRIPSRRASRKRPVERPVIVPPTKAAESKLAFHPLSRRAAIQKTLRCLHALCETGASDDAISETRRLVAQLGVTPQPFARNLSAVLKHVLSFREGSLLNTPGIPSELVDRAAAACDARGRRKPGEIVLSFAGDCTFGTVNGDGGAGRFPSVYRRSGRVDYPFALVRPWFRNDDLTVVNFECTLTDAVRTADKQWHFAGPARYASIFPASSVEAAGLANNHSHDYLQAGFDDTVANFHKAHVPVFYQNTPFVTTLQGVQVVLIGDCTVVGENTSEIDGAPQRVLSQIKRYKKPGNIVIVVMHWGSELATTPFPWQQKLGRKFIDAGADAVVGHHPHVLQGIERYKGRYIAYSLGNFAFGGNSLARNPETVILRLRFRVGAGTTSTLTASLVPGWTTSSPARNKVGILKNNYQPRPVFGKTADRTIALVLRRSAGLKYRMRKIEYLRLR